MDSPGNTEAASFTNDELAALEAYHPYPIRRIGNIQPHGIIIALQANALPETFNIVQVSANTEVGLGEAPSDLLGRSPQALFVEDTLPLQLQQLAAAKTAPAEMLLTSITTGQRFYAQLYSSRQLH